MGDMTTLGWISFITGLIGAVCIAVYTYPALIQTMRTKNTTGIPLIMFCILGFGSFFFLINGVTGIVENWSKGPGVYAILMGLAAANFFSLISAIITLSYKFTNMRLAKKYHMTEAQLCDRLARLAGVRGYKRGDDPERAKFTVDKKLAEQEQKRDKALIELRHHEEAVHRLDKIHEASGKKVVKKTTTHKTKRSK